MNDSPEFINEIAVIQDKLFQEVLFNAKGQQFRIHFSELKSTAVKDVRQQFLAFYALAGYGLSVQLYRRLEKLIPAVIEQLP